MIYIRERLLRKEEYHLVNYVKFIRGSRTSWEKLINKDKDTLYFIYEDSNANSGVLYLGDKLISGNSSNSIGLDSLNIDQLQSGDILIYDATTNSWTVKPPVQAIPIMTGATDSTDGTAGLVPVPKAGNNNLFLQGNGSWADPVPTILKKQVSDLVALDAEKSAREIAAEETEKLKQVLMPITNSLTTKIANLEAQNNSYITGSVFVSQVGNLQELFNYNSTHNTIVDAVNELDERLRWQKMI